MARVGAGPDEDPQQANNNLCAVANSLHDVNSALGILHYRFVLVFGDVRSKIGEMFVEFVGSFTAGFVAGFPSGETQALSQRQEFFQVGMLRSTDSLRVSQKDERGGENVAAVLDLFDDIRPDIGRCARFRVCLCEAVEQAAECLVVMSKKIVGADQLRLEAKIHGSTLRLSRTRLKAGRPLGTPQNLPERDEDRGFRQILPTEKQVGAKPIFWR